MQPILSVRDLCSRLGVRPHELRKLAAEVEGHYRPFTIRKKSNPSVVRHVRAPDSGLKDIQSRIKNNVLSHFQFRDGVHGGVPGCSPASNAIAHLGQRCVVKLDVKSFFPSIRHGTVYRMFRRELGFGRDVASILTRLTTVDGQVPQGAPTSTAIANIVLSKPVDQPVSAAAQVQGVRYTRFVDDVTLSGDDPRPVINVVARALSRRQLKMYRKKSRWVAKSKLRILPSGHAQEVTGLVVNGAKGLSVSRVRRDKIRAAIWALRNVTDPLQLSKGLASVRGKLAHIRPFNPGSARRLERYLQTVIASDRPSARASFYPTKQLDINWAE